MISKNWRCKYVNNLMLQNVATILEKNIESCSDG